MKTFFLACLCILASCFSLSAQEPINEPEFIGEALLVSSDNVSTQLEKTTVQIKTKAAASVYLTGIGKVKTRINVEGTQSRARAKANDDFRLIIRAVDNNTDPMSIISIFEMEIKGKNRRAELSSYSTFGGSSDNNLELVPFVGKKYGESSYMIKLSDKKPGEYGIIVRNPNSLDERTTIVATFGIE